ncbi:AAA family ATPase [Demequina sp. NBRC 110052]|uniref:AAA family ATPase n=1 Tax=Demequina sp. NBRC 110052 TaxID=1570341 RepID=UPI000A063EEC|nr:SMC family ATPase [Demequina sp. NBRC 110052]
MRVLTLELEGFGPYLAAQTVDFGAFETDGLFVITGRTGAGKSTILDAICFALYGSVPRYEGGEKTLRSHFCSEDDSTWVRLIFEVGGERYRIWRSPDYERAKKRGEGTTTKAAEAELHVWRGDDWEPLEVKPREAGHRIGEIMQLSAEQFLQVILLAQGRFQDFLQAGTRERLDVLRSLFGTQRFSALESHVRELAKEAGREVETSDTALSGLIARVANLAGQEMPKSAGRDAWLAEVLAGLTEASTTADAARTGAAKAAEAAGKALAAAESTAERARKVATARADLAALEERADAHATDVARLEAARRAVPVAGHLGTVEAARSRAGAAARGLELALAQAQSSPAAAVAHADGAAGLSLADAAALRDRATSLTAERGSLKDALEREESLPRLREAAHEASEAVTLVRARRDEISADLERLPAEIKAIQQRRTEAAATASRADDLAQAVARAQKAVAAHERAAVLSAELADAHQRELEASETRRTAVEAHADLLRRRLASEGARIAAELKPGEPCAVCGSTEHPHPAQPSDDHVTDAEVEAAADAARVATGDFESASQARADVQTRVELARSEAGEGTVEDARATLESARAQASAATEAAETVAELEATLTRLDARESELKADLAAQSQAVEAAQTAATQTAQRVTDAESTASQARGDFDSVSARASALDDAIALLGSLAAAREEDADAAAALVQATQELTSALSEAGFDSADEARAATLPSTDLATLSNAVEEHERGLAAARAVLASISGADDDAAHDLDEVDAAVSAARESHVQAKAAHEQAITSASHAGDRLGQARELAHEYEAKAASTARARERRDVVENLANTLEGKEPNDRRMRLESFVLAAKLEQIVAAANARLTTMSSGQYTLEYDDGAQFRGAQSGLDLRIADAHTGRSRSTRSLSGGETFLASLALALGLAETVTAEAGGIRLDTLFIDEGFGSLDEDTLEIAMSTLDDLRSGGRTVGLISHVEAMKEAIPAKLEVSKRADGSSEVRSESAGR